MKWKTKEGKILELSEMTDAHIENAIKYCNQRGDYDSVELLREEKKRRWMDEYNTCSYCNGRMYRTDISCNCDMEVGFVMISKYAFVCAKCGSRGPIHRYGE